MLRCPPLPSPFSLLEGASCSSRLSSLMNSLPLSRPSFYTEHKTQRSYYCPLPPRVVTYLVETDQHLQPSLFIMATSATSSTTTTTTFPTLVNTSRVWSLGVEDAFHTWCCKTKNMPSRSANAVASNLHLIMRVRHPHRSPGRD